MRTVKYRLANKIDDLSNLKRSVLSQDHLTAQEKSQLRIKIEDLLVELNLQAKKLADDLPSEGGTS